MSEKRNVLICDKKNSENSAIYSIYAMIWYTGIVNKSCGFSLQHQIQPFFVQYDDTIKVMQCQFFDPERFLNGIIPGRRTAENDLSGVCVDHTVAAMLVL